MRLTLIIVSIVISSISVAQKKTEHWDNGQKKTEGKMKDGKKNGTWKSWYRSGELATIEKYKAKKDKWIEGMLTEFYKTGEKMYELNYIYDNHSEQRTAWYPDGKKMAEGKSEMTDKKMLPELQQITFYPDGNKKSEETFNLKTQRWFYKEYSILGGIIKEGSLQTADSTTTNKKIYTFLNNILPLPDERKNWMEYAESFFGIIYSKPQLIGFFKSYDETHKPIKAISLNKESISVSYYDLHGNKIADSTFVKDTLNDVWLHYYKNDTLIYSANYYQNDTVYLYPTPCYSCQIEFTNVYGKSLNGYEDIPDTLPDYMPDGTWMQYADKLHKYRSDLSIALQLDYRYFDKFLVALEINFKDHKKNGIARQYSMHVSTDQNCGRIGKAPFDDPYRNCWMYFCHDNFIDTNLHFIKGSIELEAEYLNGMLDGNLYKFDANKKLIETHYTRDTINGTSLSRILETGKIKFLRNYKMGHLDGLYIEYYCYEGDKYEEGNYKMGKKEGIWRVWDEKKQLMNELFYKDHKLMINKSYKNGKLVETTTSGFYNNE